MRIATAVFVGLTVFPDLVLADQSVAGYWKADLGDGVTIDMNMTADGQWDSHTDKDGKVIAEIVGKYKQTIQSPTTGKLVFTPSQSHVTSAHGAPSIEYDAYELSADKEELRLTSAGDTMEFHKIIP